MPRGNKLVSTLRTSFKRASSSYAASYSIENCPIRSFAKNHPEAARLILETPPFPHRDSSSSSSRSPPFPRDETLEDYLKWRRWDVNIHKILREHRLEEPALESAAGLLSHPLSFPLTLGRHAHRFATSPSKRERRSRRICCVGARSECTLPDDYWREFLIATFVDESRRGWGEDDGRNLALASVFEWIIDFVGPDVPARMKSKSIFLFDHHELHSCPQRTLTMNYHTAFLHDLILRRRREFHNVTTKTDIPLNFDNPQTIQEFWDGFVLFNPGLGHPNLAKQWRSTFQFLCDTGKPILLTAHSTMDARRDMAVIENMHRALSRMDVGCNGYRENPYASRMKFIDPSEPVRVVWCMWFDQIIRCCFCSAQIASML
ncbi:hypothetical protein ACHAW6_014800 [Cyclotella cf. meneghiniana]